MPTLRACLIRFTLKHTVGRRFRKAGRSVAELRKLEDMIARSQRPPKGTSFSPVTVGGVPAEWVRAPGASGDAAILYLHGGAFVMGSLATHRELAARVSAAARARVLCLGYRLAPEFPFPAALEDAKTAYGWLLAGGCAPRQLAIGGDSSGAGLALQVLLSLRDDGAPMPCAGFFMSPVTDWVEPERESFATRAELDPLVGPSQCRYTASLYVGDDADDPLLRPAEMDLAGLPPLWIQVGDREILLGHAERLASRAMGTAVEVDFRVWRGMWHVFQGAARYVPEGRQSLEELGIFLREKIGSDT